MNIDDFITENEILIGGTIEDKPQEQTKEEIKTGGTKSVPGQNGSRKTLDSFKVELDSYYNGGDDILSLTCNSFDGDEIYLTLTTKDSYEVFYYLSLQNYESSEIVFINGDSYRKLLLFSPTDERIGINFYFYQYDYSINSLEIIPKTGQSIGDNPTVSSNDYSEYLETIISKLGGIQDGVESISNNIVSSGNGSGNNNNSQVGSVSQNVLTTPINEYNLTDSLIVIELSIGLIVGIILLIRRLIYKWS